MLCRVLLLCPEYGHIMLIALCVFIGRSDVTCFADAHLERIGSACMPLLQTEGAVCKKPVSWDEEFRIGSAVYFKRNKF